MAYSNAIPAWLLLPDDHPYFIERMAEIKKGKTMNEQVNGTPEVLEAEGAAGTVGEAAALAAADHDNLEVEQTKEVLGEETEANVVPVEV